MKHTESDLQIRCLKWFRYEYPYLAKLMFHPKNENTAGRVQGAIAKAEGVVSGVADLILSLPSTNDAITYASLAIEMKTKTGRQSDEQKTWQRYFEAACGEYIIVRDIDEFEDVVKAYVKDTPSSVVEALKSLYADIEKENADKARAEFRKLLKQNKHE